MAHADHQRAGRALGALARQRARRRRRRLVVGGSPRGGRPHRGAASPSRWLRRRGPARRAQRPHGGARVRRRRLVGARRRAVVRRLGDPAPPPPRAGRRAGARSRPSPRCPAASATRTATSTRTARCCSASRRSTTPTGARPPTRSCGSPPTSRARPRSWWRVPTSSRIRAGHPTGRLLLARVGPPRHAVGRHPPRRGRRERRGARSSRGRPRESIGQPTWAPDGSLWFFGDRTGFWSLYRWTPDRRARGRRRPRRRHRLPAVGVRSVDLRLPRRRPGRLRALGRRARAPGGAASRAADGSPMRRRPVTRRSTAVRARVTRVVCIAAGATDRAARRGDRRRRGDRSRCSCPRATSVSPTSGSREPEPITFPTAGGQTAHALLYRPANPDAAAPDGERPPLLVMIHGGPTAAARPCSSCRASYWTSRGFAVVDVNYRGSTGYGRAYRDLLQGQWGIADVEDCAAVCAFLVERGDVDPDRLLHPRRLRRRLHHAGRAHVPRGVRGRGEPLRRRRPRRRSPRTPTSSRAATSTASSGRWPEDRATSTRSARRSSTPIASTGRSRCSRVSTTRSCRPTRPR